MRRRLAVRSRTAHVPAVDMSRKSASNEALIMQHGLPMHSGAGFTHRCGLTTAEGGFEAARCTAQ